MQKYSCENMPDSGLLDRLYELMQQAFPPEERRTFDDLCGEFSNSEFFCLCEENDGLNAFMTCWELGEFIYIEHFAVQKNLRGNGLGSRMINSLLQEAHGRIFILEAEPKNLSEMAQRRMDFYGRLGFCENGFDYIQPPLSDGQPPVELKILSAPRLLSEDEFTAAKNLLYSKVYAKCH